MTPARATAQGPAGAHQLPHQRLLRLKRMVFNLPPRRYRLPLRVRWMSLTGTLEPEIRDIERIVPPGGKALDVGANHGVYSYFLVRHFDEVVAFEPQPACASTLESWARGRVDVRRIALSDHRGEGQLTVPLEAGVEMTGYARLDNPGGDTASSLLPVALERLDEQGLMDVRFIKIDVEGHELAVLQGGQHLLERDRPVLLVEIEQRHLGTGRRVADVVDHLVAHGYTCFFRDGSSWATFGTFRPEVHQNHEQVDRGDYVSMFLFLPEGQEPLPTPSVSRRQRSRRAPARHPGRS